jgi:hypothetical protein
MIEIPRRKLLGMTMGLKLLGMTMAVFGFFTTLSNETWVQVRGSPAVRVE